MKSKKLESYLEKLIHHLSEINQEIFSSGDYKDFLSLCNNDISIIALLDKHPGTTAKQISIKLNLSKTTVITAVSRLVKRGYIIKEKNLEDGREQLLKLTDLGEGVNKKHKQYEKYFIEEFMNLFREEDYEALKGILERSRLCTITE